MTPNEALELAMMYTRAYVRYIQAKQEHESALYFSNSIEDELEAAYKSLVAIETAVQDAHGSEQDSAI
jgi:hypothetical protein